jgi:outer membrane protein assembly factor BamB
MKKFIHIAYLATCATLIAGCSALDSLSKDKETPLTGDRVSILELERHIEPDSDVLNAQGFVAPAQWRNEYWPQAGGYPNHAMQHMALNPGPLQKIWETGIGTGARKDLPLTAQPIVVDGRIFTMDSEDKVSAFTLQGGKELWEVNVSNPNEDEPVISGGLSYSRGRLFVTSGYNEVLALSPTDGSLVWRVKIPAPARAAPAIVDNRLFIVTLDNRLVALSTETGQYLWEYAGISEGASLVGAASPATSNDIVVPAFSSGEIFALRLENGSVAWGENLTSLGTAGGLSALSDIQGMPVIDKGLVIAISFGGRMIAIDERTGSRVWQRDIGSSETPWVAGNHVFVLTTESELAALGRDNGSIRWVTELPRYEDPDSKKGAIYWTGPILAGERLIIAGSNGDVLEVNPADGKIIRTWSAGGAVAIAPVVAAEVLYLLREDGTLMAYK